jgi:predicted flap endonuclease-1-like 5' DNA nuclease
MRSDYALYTVAIIFFILTAIVVAYQVEFKELWVVTTAVLGLFFIGLGYTQKPRPQPVTVETLVKAPAPAVLAPSAATEVVKEEKPGIIVEAAPTKMGLTEVKGIGEKRAEQLKALGISSVEDLAKASEQDLAEKLKISPKITGKWIENSKKLLEKP